jgi:hypothetical protein
MEEGKNVRQLLVPSTLSAMVGEQVLGLYGAKAVLDTIKAEAGRPADPIERMMIEQFSLAHHRLAILNANATNAKAPECVRVYNAAASRLLGELRRMALAIKAYREPAAQRSFSVINQQNVVAGGHQQVAYVDGGRGRETLVARDELSNKRLCDTARLNGSTDGDDGGQHDADSGAAKETASLDG